MIFPTHTGVTPYEYVHGRARGLAKIPYRPAMASHEAETWLKNQKVLHEKMAEIANHQHQKWVERINRKRRDPP